MDGGVQAASSSAGPRRPSDSSDGQKRAGTQLTVALHAGPVSEQLLHSGPVVQQLAVPQPVLLHVAELQHRLGRQRPLQSAALLLAAAPLLPVLPRQSQVAPPLRPAPVAAGQPAVVALQVAAAIPVPPHLLVGRDLAALPGEPVRSSSEQLVSYGPLIGELGAGGGWRDRASLRRPQGVVQGTERTFGAAGATPEGLNAAPVRRSTGTRSRTLGQKVFVPAAVWNLVVSEVWPLIVAQTGSVYAEVAAGVVVTGVTGATPWSQ